jgi:hypothetical protein
MIPAVKDDIITPDSHKMPFDREGRFVRWNMSFEALDGCASALGRDDRKRGADQWLTF